MEASEEECKEENDRSGVDAGGAGGGVEEAIRGRGDITEATLH